MITIGYSTRQTKPQFQEYIKKTCGIKNAQVIEVVNNGIKSLPEVYNEIIEQSNFDIVVLCHDDIEFDTNNWGSKLIKHFQRNPEYGILGMAGSKYLPSSGKWWEVPHTMYGIVNHKHEGKKWTSTYSKHLNNKVEEVVLIDGLFISFDKNKIKYKFNTNFGGFHFYDLSFCVPNYTDGVKIGVISDIRLTHLSIGMTNDKWEQNRIKFSETYKENLPIDITNKNNAYSTFIFCHDQDIILNYIKNGKFGSLSNLKYMFLGNRPTDKIEGCEDVIIARNLEYNMEEYPTLNAFTGWYALWKNNLIKTKYVNLFEYDLITHENLGQIISKFVYDVVPMIGYIPFPCSNFHFIDNKEWVGEFFESVKKVYNLDLEKTIRVYMRSNPNMMWSSTSNSTMSYDYFNSYMKWFTPISDLIKSSKTAGHAHERSISFYYIVNKINVMLTQGLIKHYQMDSHGTQGHYVDYDKNIKELTENKI